MKTILTLIYMLVVMGAMAQTGTVAGRITDQEAGGGLTGASISVKGTNLGVVSGADGRYRISGIPAGTQTLVVRFVGYTEQSSEITVVAGTESTLDFGMQVSHIFGEEVVVSASRRAEKITEAPATVSVLTARDFAETASFNVGELASKIQGVEFVRTGVTGVGFNARGFNNAFNAKILTMTDGRNSMMAGGSGLPSGIMNTVIKEDIDRMEIVLGPNSALYGPNAHNGVVNTITKDPRKYHGTTLAVGVGNQSVFSGRLRHAQKLSDKLAFKLTGEYTQGKDFEFYDKVFVGAAVVDEMVPDFKFKHLRGEAGLYYAVNPKSDIILSYGGSNNDFLSVNNTGRNRIDDWKFSYLQGRYVSPRWFGQLYYTWTNVGNSYSINSYTTTYVTWKGLGATDEVAHEKAYAYPNRFKEQSGRVNGEVQYNYPFDEIGLHVVASLSYQKDFPNTFGTSLADSPVPGEQGDNLITVEQVGGAIQLDKKLTPGLKVVGALRVDHHSVFGNMVSPKIALVQKAGNGNFRATWGKAFSAPIILFQSASVIGYVFGNGAGVSYLPVGGNINNAADVKVTTPLVPEEINTFELGYKGTLSKKLYADVNAYYGRSENFLSPAIATAGRAQKVGDIPINSPLLLPGATDDNGVLQPGAVFATYFNYGNVDSWGVDLGLNYFFTPEVSLGVKYSYFDSDITENRAENDANRDGYVSLEERSKNAPTNRVAATLSFKNIAKSGVYANISARWVQEFDFYSGSQIAVKEGVGQRGSVYAGPNPLTGADRYIAKNWNYGPMGGFTTVDLSLGYAITPQLNVGAAVSNLFNVEQREFPGSPLIKRLISAELRYHIPYNK